MTARKIAPKNPVPKVMGTIDPRLVEMNRLAEAQHRRYHDIITKHPEYLKQAVEDYRRDALLQDASSGSIMSIRPLEPRVFAIDEANRVGVRQAQKKRQAQSVKARTEARTWAKNELDRRWKEQQRADLQAQRYNLKHKSMTREAFIRREIGKYIVVPPGVAGEKSVRVLVTRYLIERR